MMSLPDAIQTTLVELSRRASPREACGIACVAHGKEHVLEIRNIHAHPEDCFAVDPDTFWEGVYRYRDQAPSDQLLLCWHSHPRTRAHPSLEDIAFMQRVGLPMAIVSLRATVPLIRLFVADLVRPTASEIGSYRVMSQPAPLSR